MPDSLTPADPSDSQSSTGGLINTAPGSTTKVPGSTPPGNTGPGAPVTSYTPSTATTVNSEATTYHPDAFTVAPNQTVAGQIKDIVASGSPLMQQAEASARSVMQQRGLLNSSMAITAGQDSLYKAALPIAASDAATWDKAMTNTTTAENEAAKTNAGAANTSSLLNAQLGTNTEQFNAGQENAALNQAATASNTIATTAQQIQGSKDLATIQTTTQKAIADLQANTSLSVADKQAAVSTLIAGIQSNTSLSLQDMQDQTNTLIQFGQQTLGKYLGDLQANTQMTVQDRANAATLAKGAADNVTSQAIAGIQSNTNLTIAQQQFATQTLITGMNNQNQQIVQNMVNAGNLANIQANGEINTKITAMTDANKLLLQSSQGASNLYSQTLQKLADLEVNKDLDASQKMTSMNNLLASLDSGLAVFSKIAGLMPELSTDLNFINTGGDPNGRGIPWVGPRPVGSAPGTSIGEGPISGPLLPLPGTTPLPPDQYSLMNQPQPTGA